MVVVVVVVVVASTRTETGPVSAFTATVLAVQSHGVMGLVLGLVGPVSECRDWETCQV